MAEVVDEKDVGRFALDKDGCLRQLVYRLDGDRLVLEHTAVPGELSRPAASVGRWSAPPWPGPKSST